MNYPTLTSLARRICDTVACSDPSPIWVGLLFLVAGTGAAWAAWEKWDGLPAGKRQGRLGYVFRTLLGVICVMVLLEPKTGIAALLAGLCGESTLLHAKARLSARVEHQLSKRLGDSEGGEAERAPSRDEEAEG